MTLYIYMYLSDTCQCIAQHMNKVWLIWPNKEKTIHHFIWGAIACYGLVLHTQSYGVYAMQEIMYKHVGILCFIRYHLWLELKVGHTNEISIFDSCSRYYFQSVFMDFIIHKTFWVEIGPRKAWAIPKTNVMMKLKMKLSFIKLDRKVI